MRETIRAVIVNSKGQVFLVQHKEFDPINQGKWATPGGGLEQTDANHMDGLKRELSEEFGSDALDHFVFGPMVRVSRREDRVDYFYGVHFGGVSLAPQAPEEILEAGWFSLEDASRLNTFFGIEFSLAKEVVRLFC
jgi:8-oxo-dGTP pyrophosphatase MutT (NUDIX family)